MLRLATPRLLTGLVMSLAFRLQRVVKAAEHAPRVSLVDLVLVRRAEDSRGVDIAFGVVVRKAGFRVDSAHRADHLAGKQDVVDRDDLGQKVDARLMINAGIEEDILQKMLLEQRLFQLL